MQYIRKKQIKTNEYEKELLIMDGRCADDGYRHEQPSDGTNRLLLLHGEKDSFNPK
jgi:hypothetical protein